MSTREEYGPRTSDIELPPRLTPRLLIDTFRSFANNNAAFREGLTDEIGIEVTSGECKPADVQEPPDYLRMRFIFKAGRERYLERLNNEMGEPSNATREYHELAFKLAVVAVREAIL